MRKTRHQSHSLERLRVAGLRPTRQRLALANLLFEGKDRHVTAEHLHAEASGASIRVSLATVYNTLHQFTARGLLREIVVDAARSYFDTNTRDHHHFFFKESGSIEDIPGEEIVFAKLPKPPAGKTVNRIDVVVSIDDESP